MQLVYGGLNKEKLVGKTFRVVTPHEQDSGEWENEYVFLTEFGLCVKKEDYILNQHYKEYPTRSKDCLLYGALIEVLD